MLTVDSYDAVSTQVMLSPTAPTDLTGLERIILAAQGDLQRILSAFFSRPIFVERIDANTSPRLRPVSPQYPITQARKVHLKCASRVVCIATSTITITSPEYERVFLDEKLPIGQTFRRLNSHPKFDLLDVGAREICGRRELHRTYRLETEGFAADILEVFPDRNMFIQCEDWLTSDTISKDVCRFPLMQLQRKSRLRISMDNAAKGICCLLLLYVLVTH
ncbi:hypothetical protein BJ138DRAFT_1161451 [Hygrophoropsis aurantiaca]|uniref:Uncharacterized protein n=1 Tax=Hygrophoropsis aurantiaca TaxID=72124 RepID=A0ACB8A0T7_9AGAM|nr:hypothetical protein BJ138DRAFT_1161451 [Hygrophoropsis aurantiaca]